MPNYLVGETSPYLRQHQNNPVNWRPWNDQAISIARKENKPIFLSIGYAACHWCHVMAHESFEDLETARILNKHFISIKVDREERPDLDDIYMQALLMMKGQGGWPMSIFLTPSLKPFFGGTYFPPEPRYGMPSFKQVLLSVIDSWDKRQDEIKSGAQSIMAALHSQFNSEPGVSAEINFDRIVDALHSSYDWEYGGWGQAPKFPPAMLLEWLLQRAGRGDDRAKEMSDHLLNRMAMGGMYDLVGGGFHRYSVDRQWLVPHFEKMLYDNALLALAYVHGFTITKNPHFRHVAENTLAFIQQEMTAPEGGFYSSLDADTPQGEGRYYTWTYETLKSALSSDEFSLIESITTIRPQGNFEEGLNVLQYKNPLHRLAQELKISFESFQRKLNPILEKLQKLRAERRPPGVDTKVILSWNSLAVRAFLSAGRILDREDFADTGRKALDFIKHEMLQSSGELYRVWHEGEANHPATLSDTAGLILALHAIYEIDFSPETYKMMRSLQSQLSKQFTPDKTYYYDSAKNVEHLILRPKSLQDNARPSGNALAAHANWLGWNYEQDQTQLNQLDQMLQGISEQINHYPNHYGYWLQIADLHYFKTTQIALVTEAGFASLSPFLNAFQHTYHPHSILAADFAEIEDKTELPKLLNGKKPINAQPTAFVCQEFACHAPTNNVSDFLDQVLKTKD
jgi:uncharacterized protein